jgi:hypothetical protein
MLKVTVISKGTNPSLHIKKLSSQLHFEGQEEVIEVAEKTADEMRTFISANKKRPATIEDSLVKNMVNKTDNTTGGVSGGIGDIEVLKEKAKHFELIDLGGEYETKETFTPPPFEDGEFRTFKKGSKHTIEGIGYVSYGFEIFKDLLDVAIEKINKYLKE